ncbi:uncharacterized protein LOC118419725 isoform X2 [Branchiostoma floridae]|uniref:Uncharacterized protein LOC118419725 isoform X2 n=1 Tax=Branchiostoma floridae TaxID=7739 RepID=A0A9J7LI53_BRAFL|nr:uncharacterized protein LOC118419725 isoform X2 [Branchiostoma floridae]
MVKKTELYQPVGWLLTVLGLVTVGLGAGGDRVGLTTATVCVCTGLGVAVAGIVGIICGRKSEEGQLNVWTVGLTLSATLLSVTALVLNLQPLVCADPPDWTGDVTGYHQGYDGAIRDVAHEAKYQHGEPNPSAPKYGLACEHQTLTATCPAGQVIRIVSALYGRTQPEAVCGGAVYTTQCRSTTSLTVVQDRCNGQQSCSVTASNSEFGDPCVGTFKYLEIEYECTFTESLRGPNLAQGRPTQQSSVAHDGVPARAVDGVLDGVYSGDSCTHTQLTDNPWWRVDLGSSRSIGDVVIFNRQDCCSERLNPFQVHVGISPDDVGSNPTCGGDHTVPAGQAAVTVDCRGHTGRYVGIMLPTRQYLTLCEVQVYEDVQVERLGCWADTADRAIPTVEGSDPRLDGPYQSRQRAFQKCKAVAQSQNFSIFALQNGGWCASSAGAGGTYRMYGPSGDCRADGRGGPWANEVYKIIRRGSLQNELVCEHQTVSLQCPDGQQIRVVSASYGRTDETVCGGPVHTTRCSSRTSLTVMKKVCDNRQSCVVSAENSVFGDPCVGTFKYLEVAYACNPAPEPPPPVTPRYLGCYEDHPERVFPSDRMDSDGMTSDLCIRHCREYGHQYAATQYAHECWCGSQGDFVGIGVRRPDSECDLPCPGRSMSDEMCGGTWRMSVYRTGRAEAPSHPLPIETTHSQLQRLGCWTDTIDRAVPTLEGSDPRLDGRYESRTDAVRKCRDAAARRGYTVFAIQNGGWCAASANALQTYHRYGRSDACRADGEGGPWANEVYKIVTGPQLQPGLVCEHSTMSIQCPAHKVIRIQSAMYGRAPGGSVCGTVYTGAPCRSPTSLPVLQERCDGREACSVQAENGVFGDPCVGTFKYLAVENECVGVSGYKGCYEDTESRRFPADFMSSEEMTSEMCVRHCKGNGHAYAATQYSRECWCGSEHHFDGLGSRRPETECDKPCPGNADQWCGGTWRMSVYSVQDRNVCEAPSTDTQYRYRWDLPRLTEDRFTFDVQANNDVHVGLSSQSQDLDDMYEIVIGGWSNTQSVIRRSKQGNNLVTVSTSGIISPTEYRKFWITWSSDGTIAVGKGGDTQPFMQWTDPDPLPIAYAGYTTGWGSTGRWKFCHTAQLAETGMQSAVEAPRQRSSCTPCRHIVFYVKISTSIMVALSLLACLLACWGYRRSSSKSGVVNRNLVKLPPDIFSISTTPLPGPTHGMAPVGPAMPDDPPPPYSQDTLPHQATTDA